MAIFRAFFSRLSLFVLMGSSLNGYGIELKVPHDARLIIGVYRPSLSNYVDLKDIEISLNYWLQEVNSDLHIDTTETRFYKKFQDLSAAFARRDIDMFIAPPLAIVMHFNKQLMSEGFYSKSEYSEGDALLLLARSDNVASIKNLVGKRLMLPKHDKLAEIFLEMMTLETYQKNYNQVFSRVDLAPKMNRIILSLFFGAADVALAYKSSFDVMVEMNPQIKSRIKILKSYPVLSKNMTFIHKDYPYRKWIIEKVKSFADHPRGQQILNIYQAAKIGVSTVDMLDPFELLYQQYLSLKSPILRKY